MSYSLPLNNPSNFCKFKNIMREFKITKQQLEYELKLKTIEEVTLSPKSDFKPKLSKKSETIDRQAR